MRRFRSPRLLPPAESSASRLLRLAPKDMMLFRWLLEAYDNLASHTVLDKHECLVRLLFSPDSSRELDEALKAISSLVPFEMISEADIPSAPHPLIHSEEQS